MLKAKTNKNSHRSRTVDEAIEEVKKVDKVGVHFKIDKDKRLKFKRKAEDNGTDMQDLLVEYINNYIAD